MLTIRAMGIHGDQSVFQAATVIRGSDAEKTNGEAGQIEFYDAQHNEAHDPIYFGNVYVMNENGKTVASFEMGGWKQ